MAKKFTAVRRGPHTLFDGRTVDEGEEVQLSADDEKNNVGLIEGGALAPSSEVKDESGGGEKNG